MTTELTTKEMLSDLTITFPTLWKRPLSEFGIARAGKSGVWTGSGGGDLMPDGEQIFCTLADGTESPYRNPPFHEAFEVWLSNRGWSWENYDGMTFFLLPNSSFNWLDEWHQGHRAAFPKSAVVDSDP